MSATTAPESQTSARFGTFTGVFTPTLLTILGVIMFVRLGWCVGNAGLMGAFVVMGLAMGITVCTGLSLSSIATNTPIGAGGPYAIISRSLGVEVGGSIGVPLYLSRPLGVAMYIFGFREGWQWFFPTHDPLLVDCLVFGALFALAFISADLAFRVQYVIMGVIVVSLISVFASPGLLEPVGQIEWFGEYPGFPEDGFQGIDFWVVFAIFFPATTGILAGANMSGDLKDPRVAIPHGTMWAIVLSCVIYFALAVVATKIATPEELVSNYNVLIDRALWPAAVLLGLLGATFSSALASFVGGPRILMAMGQNNILPQSEWLARVTKGEPRNAILLTAILTFVCLLMRDLNVIAPLVTMFFLITYFVINVVLLVESSLGLVSFRPTMRVAGIFPLLGAAGCIFVMFIVNPLFSLVAVAVVVSVYIYVLKRGVKTQFEDVRSGIFGAVAEWAAARVTEFGPTNVRAWKPNLLVPVEDPDELRGEFHLLLDMCLPEGSCKLLGLTTAKEEEVLRAEIDDLASAFHDKGLFATWSIVKSEGFLEGVMYGLQALQSAFFRPNILFLRMPDLATRLEEFSKVIVQAHNTGVGIILLAMHPKAGLGQSRRANLWVRRDRSGWSTDAAFEHNNLDLTLLLGYRLQRRWKAELNLITVVPDESEREEAEGFLTKICKDARLPKATNCCVLVGTFDECVKQAPQSDIDILGLQENPDFAFIEKMVRLTRSTCLFVADSGRESARA